MTLPSIRPVRVEGGYVSSYGHLSGLRDRLQAWVDRMARDKTLPWAGLGIIRDLEVILQLLNLQEFAEWLRVNGPPEHRAFADDILADQFTLEAADDAARHVRNLPAETYALDPVATIEKLDDSVDAMRRVLVETGALADDDHETPLPDLLRALLS